MKRVLNSRRGNFSSLNLSPNCPFKLIDTTRFAFTSSEKRLLSAIATKIFTKITQIFAKNAKPALAKVLRQHFINEKTFTRDIKCFVLEVLAEVFMQKLVIET